MAILQLLKSIIINNRRVYNRFLACKLYIYYIFLTLDPTQPDPPKTENFVTQPDPTQPNPTRPEYPIHGWTRPMSNSAVRCNLQVELCDDELHERLECQPTIMALYKSAYLQTFHLNISSKLSGTRTEATRPEEPRAAVGVLREGEPAHQLGGWEGCKFLKRAPQRSPGRWKVFSHSSHSRSLVAISSYRLSLKQAFNIATMMKHCQNVKHGFRNGFLIAKHVRACSTAQQYVTLILTDISPLNNETIIT